MKKSLKKYYTKKYFKDRDHLDLFTAETLKILMTEKKYTKMLDVGCGTGRLVKFLNDAGFDAFGCDIYKEGLRVAGKINKPGTIIKASAFKLPSKNRSIDLITAISVIEHFKKDESVLFIKEAKRVLRKNGMIFLITPNFNSPMRYLLGKRWFGYSDPTHINFFNPSSLGKLLKQNGFKNIRTRIKSAYNVNFDWYLPKFLTGLPMPARNLINYLMISSPLSTFRDSFWMTAQNE